MTAATTAPSATYATSADTRRILVFDTTLRDGEQAPGCTMSLDQKLAVADQLVRLGVDIVEAGFPAASPGEVRAVAGVGERVGGAAVVCGLARARREDIATCARALERAQRPRIHTFLATSDVHLARKLQMTREQVIEQVAMAVAYA